MITLDEPVCELTQAAFTSGDREHIVVVGPSVQRLLVRGLQDVALEFDAEAAQSLVVVRFADCSQVSGVKLRSTVTSRLEFIGSALDLVELDGVSAKQVALRNVSCEHLKVVDTNCPTWSITGGRATRADIDIDGTLESFEWLNCESASLIVHATTAGDVNLSGGALSDLEAKFGSLRNIAVRDLAGVKLALQSSSTEFVHLTGGSIEEQLVLDGSFGVVTMQGIEIGEFRGRGDIRQLALAASDLDRVYVRSRADLRLETEGTTCGRLIAVASAFSDCSLRDSRFETLSLVGNDAAAITLESIQVSDRLELQFNEPAPLQRLTSSALAAGSVWGVDFSGAELQGTSGLDAIKVGSDCVLPTGEQASKLLKSMTSAAAREQASSYEALAHGVAASSGRWRGAELTYVARVADRIAETSWTRRVALALWGASTGYGMRPVRVLGLALGVLIALGGWTWLATGASFADAYFATFESVLQIDTPINEMPQARLPLLAARAVGPSALLGVIAAARRRGLG